MTDSNWPRGKPNSLTTRKQVKNLGTRLKAAAAARNDANLESYWHALAVESLQYVFGILKWRPVKFEGTSEQASPTPEIAADPKVLRDVTAAVEDIKNGNTLSLEEAFQNVECGQFPPQYLTCPRSGCKGVVLFLQGGPPWRAYAYSCDESECPNHSKWLMFVDHYWGKAVYASPPVMSSILFLAPNVESHILDCIFRCSRCGQTKWGIWSDEATVGFYVHKHFDKELESEQLTFECDDCALKSKP